MKKLVLALALILAVCGCAAFAADFPTKNIKLLVPFAAGGGTDSIARDIAKNMAERLGQPVVVDNRGGAGGTIGAAAPTGSPAPWRARRRSISDSRWSS